jgi:uncharacterized protein with von Willebrand factor type A (vWA) domain
MSSFSDRVHDQLRGGSWGMKPKPTPKDKTRQNVAHTRLDEAVWAKARYKPEVADGIRDLFEGDRKSTYVEDPETGQRLERHEGRPPYDNAPELIQDLYYTLFKTSPYFHEPGAVEEDAHLNREILAELLSSPRYGSLHDKTAMDEVMATFAASKFFDHIREILERASEAVDDSNAMKNGQPPVKVRITGESDDEGEGGEEGELEQDGDEPIDVEVGQGEGGGQEVEVVEDQREDPSDNNDDGEGAESSQEGSESEGEGDPSENDAGGQGSDPGEPDEGEGDGPPTESFKDALDEAGFRSIIENALAEVGAEVQELDSIRQGIGVESEEWKQMDPAIRFKLVELLQTPQMKQLADMMGRMTRFAMGQQASKIINVPHEVYDVGTGDQLQYLLQSEFALLGHPALKAEFYRRYADKELLVYKLRGKTEAGKGPIVVGCDRSGSMGMSGNTPMHWAIAVVESLRRICNLQKRDFAASFFDTRIVREFAFPGGKVEDWNEVMAMLSVAPGGGTEFMTTLDKLMGQVTSAFDVDGETKADIVFVTDGAAHIHDDWLERFLAEKERVGCRVWGIFIGGAGDVPERSYPLRTLQSFSDVVVNVNELKHDTLRNVFGGI